MSSRTDPRVARSRSRVLSAAGELLQERGLAAVTVEAVVARSGVAKTTVYRHWPSRRQLILDLFTGLVPIVSELDVTRELEDTLMRFVETIGRQLEDGPWAAALPALMALADRDPELAEVRHKVLQRSQGPLVELLGAYRRELGTVEVSDAAAQLAGPLLHRRLVDAGPIDRALVERTVKGFLACTRDA